MRTLSLLRWILAGLIVVVLAVPALAVSVGGRLIVEVDGESMTPTYQVGDIIVVREPSQADLTVGTVVTAIDGNGDYYTHRILTVNEDGSVGLKGDGNAVSDPGTVTLDNIRGVVEMHLGQPWAFALIQLQQWPLRICLLATILGLALLPLGRRRPAAEAALAVAAPPSAVVAEAAATSVPVIASTTSGRRRASSVPVSRRAKRKASHAAAPTRSNKVRRAQRIEEDAPIAFRSTYTTAEPTTAVDIVPATVLESAHTVVRDQAAPASAPAPLSSVDAALFTPLSAAGAAAIANSVSPMPAVSGLDDIDDVDAVDDVANIEAGAPAFGNPGYAITVVDGPDGQPRVRISVDLDSLALAAALAVAAPSVTSAQAPAPMTAPAEVLASVPMAFASRSAAREHAAAGAVVPISYSRDAGRRARGQHGRRRAS